MDRKHLAAAAFALLVLAAAPSGAAVRPSLEQFLPSVAHATGALPGSEFRTDVWIYNPGATPTRVTIAFSYRGPNPPAPPDPVIVDVEAEQVLELDDIILEQFGLSSALGGLRFTSTQPVVVTARIYDISVQGTNGTGTAGQFFAATPLADAVPEGGVTDVIGVRAFKEEGASFPIWRTNLGFMNASAIETTVQVTMWLDDGTEYPPSGSLTDTFVLAAWEPRQLNDVFSVLKRPYATNVRCRIEVLEGGRVVAFGSMLDGRTNDPSTLEATVPLVGGWSGTYVCKLDKTTYDTSLTLVLQNDAVTSVDATVLFTDEDAGAACTGGELVRLAGNLPDPVVPDDLGAFSFSLNGSVAGVGVTLQVSATLAVGGGISGTATTTLINAGSCSGTKTWPLIGARVD